MSVTGKFPLMISLNRVITGEGFVANVYNQMRVILYDKGEKHGFWLYAVQPSSIGGQGESLKLALEDLTKEYDKILNKIAGESSDYAEFSREADSVLRDINRLARLAWVNSIADYPDDIYDETLGSLNTIHAYDRKNTISISKGARGSAGDIVERVFDVTRDSQF